MNGKQALFLYIIIEKYVINGYVKMVMQQIQYHLPTTSMSRTMLMTTLRLYLRLRSDYVSGYTYDYVLTTYLITSYDYVLTTYLTKYLTTPMTTFWLRLWLNCEYTYDYVLTTPMTKVIKLIYKKLKKRHQLLVRLFKGKK